MLFRILIACLFVPILSISCSNGGASTLAAAAQAKTSIRGVAMLGPVVDGEVIVYEMGPDGAADKDQIIGQAKTDVDGNYTIDIPQEKFQDKNITYVIELVSGTYVEEASEETVIITPENPIRTVLPIDDSVGDAPEGVVIDAAITPFTNMAYAKNVQDMGSKMIDQAIEKGLIPPEFKDKALEFKDKGFDPAFFQENPEFQAAFEGARNAPIFREATFREQAVKFVTDANYGVAQAFGIPSPVGTMPGNPRVGAQNEAGAGYMVAMAALSKQAFDAGPGVNSIAMMNAYSNNFAKQGNFEFNPAAGPIQVRGADGKTISMPPPKFEQFTQNFTGIVDGNVALPGFVLYGPPVAVGADGQPLPPPPAGGTVGGPNPINPPEWAKTFSEAAKGPGVFNAKPPVEAPKGWAPVGMIVREGNGTLPPLLGGSGGPVFNPFVPNAVIAADGNISYAPPAGVTLPEGFKPPSTGGFGGEFNGPIIGELPVFGPPPGGQPTPGPNGTVGPAGQPGQPAPTGAPTGGGSAPAPTGGSAPAPTGGSAPAPTGGSAPAPTGGAPAPTGGAPAPAPAGGGAPAPAPAPAPV